MIHNMTRGKNLSKFNAKVRFFSCYNILERTSTAVLDSSPQYALKPCPGLFPDAVLKTGAFVARVASPFHVDRL